MYWKHFGFLQKAGFNTCTNSYTSKSVSRCLKYLFLEIFFSPRTILFLRDNPKTTLSPFSCGVPIILYLLLLPRSSISSWAECLLYVVWNFSESDYKRRQLLILLVSFISVTSHWITSQYLTPQRLLYHSATKQKIQRKNKWHAER